MRVCVCVYVLRMQVRRFVCVRATCVRACVRDSSRVTSNYAVHSICDAALPSYECFSKSKRCVLRFTSTHNKHTHIQKPPPP